MWGNKVLLLRNQAHALPAAHLPHTLQLCKLYQTFWSIQMRTISYSSFSHFSAKRLKSLALVPGSGSVLGRIDIYPGTGPRTGTATAAIMLGKTKKTSRTGWFAICPALLRYFTLSSVSPAAEPVPGLHRGDGSGSLCLLAWPLARIADRQGGVSELPVRKSEISYSVKRALFRARCARMVRCPGCGWYLTPGLL
jgi:hypothetical protein